MHGDKLTPILQALAEGVDETLARECNEPQAFVLIVFVDGQPRFVSNSETEQVMAALRKIAKHSEMIIDVALPITPPRRH